MKFKIDIWKNHVQVTPIEKVGLAKFYSEFYLIDDEWWGKIQSKKAPEYWTGSPEQWFNKSYNECITHSEEWVGRSCDHKSRGMASYLFQTKEEASEFFDELMKKESVI